MWFDWSKLYTNYLRLIPGQTGVPLSYVVRTNEEPDRSEKSSFLDTYEATAPLKGPSFNADSAEAFILIKALVTGNTEAETTVNIHEGTRDGRAAFADLRIKYEGVGIHAVARTSAEEDINKMYYIGEKPPGMTWNTFSSRLLAAYKKIDDVEQMPPGKHVHSNETKLMKLMNAVKADFLEPVKSSINVAIASNPETPFTFESAMMAFRNKVLEKYPPNAYGQSMSRRQIRKVDREAHSKTKGSWKYGGSGKEGGRNYGGVNTSGKGSKRIKIKNRRLHRDNKLMTLRDGRVIDYHPSYNFDRNLEMPFFTHAQRDNLRQQRDSWKKIRNGNSGSGGRGERNAGGRSIHELATAMSDAVSVLSRQIQSTNQGVPVNVTVEEGGSIGSGSSQTNKGIGHRSAMGGRNEQSRGGSYRHN